MAHGLVTKISQALYSVVDFMKNIFSYLFISLSINQHRLTRIKNDVISIQTPSASDLDNLEKREGEKCLATVTAPKSYGLTKTQFVTSEKHSESFFTNIVVSGVRIPTTYFNLSYSALMHNIITQFVHLDPTIKIIYGPKAVEARQSSESLVCPANAHGVKQISGLAASPLKSNHGYQQQYVGFRISESRNAKQHGVTKYPMRNNFNNRYLTLAISAKEIGYSAEKHSYIYTSPHVVSASLCFDKAFSP